MKLIVRSRHASIALETTGDGMIVGEAGSICERARTGGSAASSAEVKTHGVRSPRPEDAGGAADSHNGVDHQEHHEEAHQPPDPRQGTFQRLCGRAIGSGKPPTETLPRLVHIDRLSDVFAGLYQEIDAFNILYSSPFPGKRAFQPHK